MSKRLTLLLVVFTCLSTVRSSYSDEVVYGFDDGTFGDWQYLDVDGKPFPIDTSGVGWVPFSGAQDIGDGFNLLPATSGDYRVVPTPWSNRDCLGGLSCQTEILRSPTFELDDSGSILIDMIGGSAIGGDLTETDLMNLQGPGFPAFLPVNKGEGEAFQGFALYDIADDLYVAFGWPQFTNDGKARASDPATRGEWETVEISKEELAPFVGNGKEYALDIFDSYSGGWGWIGFDTVRIPVAGATAGIPGDADMDGDVDTADRTIQTTNWTGALPPGDPDATKTKAEGDADGDGDVDTADANLAITNWTGAQQGAGNLTDGDDANLVYDPSNGNVTLDASDTASGVFISFVMATGQNNMVPDNLSKSADGSAGPFFDVGTNTDATTFQIGQTDPLNQGAGPEIDLGSILPAGMDLAGLSEYLTLADYASALGEGGTMDLIVVPEPSSIALLLLGVMGLVARRRRR